MKLKQTLVEIRNIKVGDIVTGSAGKWEGELIAVLHITKPLFCKCYITRIKGMRLSNGDISWSTSYDLDDNNKKRVVFRTV